jgi:hypothetical protein
MAGMQDLAAALGGGGGGGDAGYAPGAGGMAGLAGPDAAAPPPEAPPDQGQEAGGYTNSLDALDGAEEALHAFITLDPDEADRAVAAQCLQQILKLKASNSQDTQQGGMKSLQRALLSQQGPGGAVG